MAILPVMSFIFMAMTLFPAVDSADGKKRVSVIAQSEKPADGV